MPPEAATTTTETTTITPPATTTATTTAKPWHDGVEPEILGHWQNKGWKLDDAKEIALASTKQARELEKHFGVPADQLLKMPKADAKPEDIKAFWGRLGAPAEAKDYDFKDVKGADGNPIAQPLADAIRDAAFNANLPKNAATAVAQSVAKHLDAIRAADTAVNTAKLAEEKAALAKNWGDKFNYNHLQAMDGARRLGITPEAVAAFEHVKGYAAVMEAMRKIGAGTSEDTFVERGVTGSGTVTTREGAVARKAELMADKAWAGRLLAGGVAETQEWKSLNTMIDGEARAA